MTIWLLWELCSYFLGPCLKFEYTSHRKWAKWVALSSVNACNILPKYFDKHAEQQCRPRSNSSFVEHFDLGLRVVRRCRVSCVTGASNWYWHTLGQGLQSLQQVRIEGECFYFFCFFTFIPVLLSSLSLSFTSCTVASISFLPFFGRQHKMTHKGWRVVKPQHNQSMFCVYTVWHSDSTFWHAMKLLNEYHIQPKYSLVWMPYHTHPKIWKVHFTTCWWVNIAGWLANSVEPDQTLLLMASDLALHCSSGLLSQYLGLL